MSDADLYNGFSAETQAGYEAWLVERYGKPMRDSIAQARRSYAEMAATEQQTLTEEYHNLEQSLANALRKGLSASSHALDGPLERHRAWVSAMWGKPCSIEAYADLADLFLSHLDFVARYEYIEPGFAEYLSTAMKSHAKRRS